MFRFIKKRFFTGLAFLSSVNPLNAIPLNVAPLNATQMIATLLECVSMTNQKWKVRP